MSEISNFLPEGTLLHGGQYRIEQHLASGGFGNTYLATDVNLKARVAIKEFYIKMINYREEDNLTVGVSNADNLGMFNSLREKFKKEAQRIFKIHHNNVVRVYALFEEFGTVYYAMDFIEGESLNNRIERDGPVDEALARSVLDQMMDALDEVHRAGLLHLDIKPHNIMVTPDGVAKLIDFGASKHANKAEATTLTGFAFTPEYAPPELTNQEYDEIGPWTDIYSLGITLFRVLSSAPIPSKREIRVNGADAFIYTQPVSEPLKRLIAMMTQGASEMRPKDIAKLRALWKQLDASPVVMQQYIEKKTETTRPVKPQLPVTGVPTPKVERGKYKNKSENKSKKSLWIPLVVAAFTAVVALTAWLALKHDAGPVGLEDGEPSSSSEQKPSIVSDNQTFNVNGVSFTMVGVQGGTFTMGATREQGGDAFSGEKPAHQVTLSSFRIGQTEVTQELWEAVMGSNPSWYKGPKLPVELVSWDDCQEFIRKLNALTGQHFRLPTEAEWEYAARGGSKSQGYKYSGSNNLDDVAWYAGNSGDNKTHDVATKRANELGIFDMSGNVWEWCQDWYGDNYYGSSPSSNPTGPSSGSDRVDRGGGWSNGGARYCRVAYRGRSLAGGRSSSLGFRLAL